MKRHYVLSFVIAWTGTGAGPITVANVIYLQGSHLGNSGASSDFSLDSSFLVTQVADNFFLDRGLSTITDIHWWGIYSAEDTPTEPDDFTVRFFREVDGLPSAIADSEIHLGAVSRSDTGSDAILGADIYSYSADIDPLTLPAQEFLWLSIVNNTAADTDDSWLWLLTDSSGIAGGAYRNQEGIAWNHTFVYRMAFNLTNDALFPDYNHNGIVDAPDYTVWRDTLGSTLVLDADGDKSGTVEMDDFRLWESYFGQTAGVGAASRGPTATVPEPFPCLPLSMTAIMIVGFQRRKRRPFYGAQT